MAGIEDRGDTWTSDMRSAQSALDLGAELGPADPTAYTSRRPIPTPVPLVASGPLELADGHSQVLFDLSEIVACVGAPNAPRAEQLVRLIRDIGVERVLFGSDVPWHERGEMIPAMRPVPSLSTAERKAILGENAAWILSLPV